MFLALKELRYEKTRYALVAGIMFLISFLVLFVSGLAQGLAFNNASSLETMNVDHFVLDKEAEHQLTRSLVSDEDQQVIEDGEVDATPFGLHMTMLIREEASNVDVAMMSVDLNSPIAPTIIEGQTPSEGQALIHESIQEEGIEIGDVVTDNASDMEFEVSGFTEDQTFSHAPIMHVHEEDWREMRDGEFIVSTIAIHGSEEEAAQVGEQLTDSEVITLDEALAGIPGYSAEQGSLTMMIVFLYIIAAFVLAAFFYVITIQKLNQFGIMKAIGSPVSVLAKSLLVQVMVLSAVSLTLAIVVTLGASQIMPEGLPFQLTGTMVAISAGLFLLTAIVGSLLSLYKVAKVDALEAIGGGK
ncbi:ABC transporter permease [Geomicrobium sp. JCM 19038]|uniref:ABC transporter permease n=1 Tax=Geomicrobium sp. JCM 19038 TaxID=1460635 RepID=UPI00045F4356|nr:ABC transporter permease [Geomicrobium sp. JCM 19038]GAK08821.1 heme efflux system permease HrtB [Geomicrobium sp. JCM 19038]